MSVMDRPTLLDIAKASDPDGRPAKVIELLNQMNPIVQDAPAFASNAPMGNRVTVRNALPTISTGKVNKGVEKSRGTTKQLVDTIGIFVGRSEIDLKQKRIIGEEAYAAERSRQDRGFEEAFAQRIASEILYGDELTDDAGFTGLAARLDALATAITGSQVHSMGSPGGGDTTSIYAIDWGEFGAHLIYPKEGAGVAAGLLVQNKLDQEGEDDAGRKMRIDVTLYDWFIGLAVKDARRIARLANIDRSDALVDAPTQGNLLFKLGRMISAMPAPAGYKRVLYTHRDIEAAMWQQVATKASQVTIQEYLGQPTAHFRGFPVRVLDQMSGAEATIS